MAEDAAMQTLERTLAYEHAASVIDALSLQQAEPGRLHLVKNPYLSEDDQARLAEAVRYLEWRGLIQRPLLDTNQPTERIDPDHVALLAEDGSFAEAPQ